MLYTYCLIPCSEDPISLPKGFMGELKLIKEEVIAAVTEPDLPQKELEQNDEKLIQAVIHHDTVIRELFPNTPLLPLRFGTYFRGEEDLLQHLASNSQRYHKKIQDLANKIELTLKLTPIPFPEDNSESKTVKGKSYLKAKKQRYQQQTNYQKQQQNELKTFQEEIHQTHTQLVYGEPQESTERFYLLLDTRDLSLFSEQIQQWQQKLSCWEIASSEPLPPYHFL